MDQFQEAEFEVETLLLTEAEVVEGAEHDGEEAGELFLGEKDGGAGGAAALFGGDLEEVGGDPGGVGGGGKSSDFGDCAVAEVADKLAGELGGSVAGVEEAIDDGEDVGGVVLGYGFEDLLVNDVGDGAHELADFVGGEDGAACVLRGRGREGRAGDGLVHDGEGVAHGTVTGFGEQGKSGVVGDDVLGFGDELELADDVVELDGVKAEVLAARTDGLRNVFGLGGGHHEDDVVGWLFEGFEQGVEGRVGDLVGFVQDVDLVFIAGWAVAGGVAEFTDFVDTAVSGGIDLDDVDGVALTDFEAGFAVVAGLGRGALGGAYLGPAVEGAGEDAGNGGLADAAVAAEDVAVGDAILGEGVEQGSGDVVLSDDVGEEGGAVLAS